jgi:hypothetical protein
MDQDCNEESYTSDLNENDNESHSDMRNGDSAENIKHSKKNLASRCFNVSDNSNYERIIRKRKRKSSD